MGASFLQTAEEHMAPAQQEIQPTNFFMGPGSASHGLGAEMGSSIAIQCRNVNWDAAISKSCVAQFECRGVLQMAFQRMALQCRSALHLTFQGRAIPVQECTRAPFHLPVQECTPAHILVKGHCSAGLLCEVPIPVPSTEADGYNTTVEVYL